MYQKGPGIAIIVNQKLFSESRKRNIDLEVIIMMIMMMIMMIMMMMMMMMIMMMMMMIINDE